MVNTEFIQRALGINYAEANNQHKQAHQCMEAAGLEIAKLAAERLHIEKNISNVPAPNLANLLISVFESVHSLGFTPEKLYCSSVRLEWDR